MFSKLRTIFIISFALFISFAVAPQYVFARPPITSGSAGRISITSDSWIDAGDLPSDFLGYLEINGLLADPAAEKTTNQKSFAQQLAANNLNAYAVNSFVMTVPYSDFGNEFAPAGKTAILYCLGSGAPYFCGFGGPPPYLKFSSTGRKYPSLWVLTQDAVGALSVYISSLTAFVADNNPPEIVQFVMPSTYNSRTVPITLVATDLDSGNDGDIAFYSFTEEFIEDMRDIVWQTYVQGVTQYQYTFSSWGANTLYAWLRDAGGGINLNVPSGFSSYQSIYNPAYFYDDNPIGSVVIIDPDNDNDTPNWLYDTATFECGLDNHPCMLNDWFGNPYPPISAKIYGVDINGDGFYDDEVWLFDSSVVGTGIETTLVQEGGIAGLGQFVTRCKMSLSGITKCPSGVPPEEGEGETPIPAISLSNPSGIVEFQSPLPGEVGQEVCIIPPPEYQDAEIYYTVYTTIPTTPTVSPDDRYTGCFDVSDSTNPFFTTLSQNATVVAMAVIRSPSGPIKIEEEKQKLEKEKDVGFFDRFRSRFRKKNNSNGDPVSQSNTYIGFKNTLKNIIKKAFAENDYRQSGYSLMTYGEIVEVPPRPFPPTFSPGRRYFPIDSEVHVYLHHPDYPSDSDITLWYDKDAYDDDFSFTQYTGSPIVITGSKTIAVHARKFDLFSGQTIEGYTRYRAFSLVMDVPSKRAYFTPGGPYLFTVPQNVENGEIEVDARGGGGGGGGGFVYGGGNAPFIRSRKGGGGGGGGVHIEAILQTTQGDKLSIIVGTAGAGGPEATDGSSFIDKNIIKGETDGENGSTSKITTEGMDRILFAAGGIGGQGGYVNYDSVSEEWDAYHGSGGLGVTILDYYDVTKVSIINTTLFVGQDGGTGTYLYGGGRGSGSCYVNGGTGEWYEDIRGNVGNEEELAGLVKGENAESVGCGGGGGSGTIWIGGRMKRNGKLVNIWIDSSGPGGDGGDGYVILDWDWLFVGTP